MKQLKNCIKLSSIVKIYVPSTKEISKKNDNSDWINKSLALLSSCFGGATASSALGAWVANDGRLVKEGITLVFAYAMQEALENSIDAIYEFCLDMKTELSQEAIALEVNGELYLI